MPFRLRRPTVTQALVGVFLPLVTGTGLLVAWIDSQRMGQLLTSASEDLVLARSAELRNRWEEHTLRRRLMLQFVQGMPRILERSQWLPLLPRFQSALASAPVITACFLGWPDGSLFRVARVRQFDGRRLAGLPPSAAFLVEVVDHRSQPPVVRREAFDGQLRSLGPVRSNPVLDRYAVQQSRWYRLALEAGGKLAISGQHLLPLSGGQGLTLSLRLRSGGGAAGVSILTGNIEKLLEQFRITPGSRVAIVDAQGRLMFSPGAEDDGDRMLPLNRSRIPPLAAMDALFRQHRQASMPRRPRLQAFRLGQKDWFGAVIDITDQGNHGRTYLVLSVPAEELLAGPRQALRQAELITLLALLLSAPLVLLLSVRIARPLRQLAHQASRIRQFDFNATEPVVSWLREVDALAITVEGMRDTIRSFLHSSAALGAEPDVERLLERLLEDAIEASGASSGVLYRADGASPEAPLLACLSRGAGSAQPSVDPPPLAAADLGAPCERTLLRLPLQSREGRLQGALELRFPEPPEPARVAFCRALSGSAAVALETRSLIAAQKALFEAFIQLLADAIDAKSPYTGGHCARVPALAKALAQAACEASEGPFADFQLNERDWEALHLAAWLHDCGKVTTPEFVVDKATKLETLHNRIHEVRMRFELLKAAEETACWRAIAEGGDRQALEAALAQAWATLDAEFAFVAACNQGGETLDPEQVARLERIAARRWRRTLDDRLGISADERRRCEGEPQHPLPVMEPLLSDRPRHRIERLPEQRLPSDNPWGFTMREPELLYNRGELTNLRISRGTLNEEERYKINEHIIQTIRMLEALPFPAHLRDVPEIAGNHHERMDGGGYPRSLPAERMSPLARMMAIADVFEALTASDRPYKSGKTLSEALVIMAAMVRDQHLDAELFQLFVRTGVYRAYALEFLESAQCDQVDGEALLALALSGRG